MTTLHRFVKNYRFRGIFGRFSYFLINKFFFFFLCNYFLCLSAVYIWKHPFSIAVIENFELCVSLSFSAHVPPTLPSLRTTIPPCLYADVRQIFTMQTDLHILRDYHSNVIKSVELKLKNLALPGSSRDGTTKKGTKKIWPIHVKCLRCENFLGQHVRTKRIRFCLFQFGTQSESQNMIWPIKKTPIHSSSTGD